MTCPRWLVLRLAWAAVILLLLLVAVLMASECRGDVTYTTQATVQVTGPRGRCYAHRVPVHWRLDGDGVSCCLTVPGPIAGQPWTCRTGRTWESLAAELLDQAARYVTPYVERLDKWLSQRRGAAASQRKNPQQLITGERDALSQRP